MPASRVCACLALACCLGRCLPAYLPDLPWLLQGLADALDEGDAEGFTTAVAEFDSLTRLDAWKTTLLVRCRAVQAGPRWATLEGGALCCAILCALAGCVLGLSTVSAAPPHAPPAGPRSPWFPAGARQAQADEPGAG